MAESKITAIGKLAMPTSMPIKLQITGIITYKLGKKDVPAGPGIIFDGNYSVQKRNDTEALHHEVCNAYPQVIDAVDNNPDKYQQWFGSPNPDRIAKVKKVYEKCYRALMENTVTYYFRGPGCDIRIYAHSHYGINKLVLCELYIKANEKSTALDKDSKQQTLVHKCHTFTLILMMLILHMEQKIALKWPKMIQIKQQIMLKIIATFTAILWNSYHN